MIVQCPSRLVVFMNTINFLSVGVLVGSPVETSDHSAFFIEVVLEQPIPRLVCGKDIYLKNSVDWKLVRRYVKGLNENEIIRTCEGP